MATQPTNASDLADRARAVAGRLAGEFDDLLRVITGCTRLLLERTPRDHPSWELIDEIRRAGDRTATLVERLLAFARDRALTLARLDVNALIGGMRPLLARLAGPDVSFALELEPALPPVLADAGALEQVLVNLIVNAREATAKGGRITVSTRARPVDAATDRVELAVSDTGGGIPPEDVERAFDPFFTTKREGLGAGLGLTIVKGLVTQLGGDVRIESELGRGTTLRVMLPGYAIAGKAKEGDAEAKTILVAEDDELVRSVVRLTLVGRGYRVLDASDGLEALSVADRFPGEIALLVSDLGMPRMDGAELAARLRARRPSVRVLLITGYGSETALDSAPQGPGVDVLEKPFDPQQLVASVRALLARAS